MPYWVICQSLVAGPMADETELAAYQDYLRQQTITLPGGEVLPACPHDHLVIRSADKPVLVDCEAADDDEPMDRECDDCGAAPGQECSWSCSSNWTAV